MSDLESKRQELEDYLAEVRAILESRMRFTNDYLEPIIEKKEEKTSCQ